MPRRNRTPPHQPYVPKTAHAPVKTRFKTKRDALAAIKALSVYNLDVALDVYQSPVDGGWYLTSSAPNTHST